LSQTPKRPGTRDISELKARLGLKKAAPEKAPAAVPKQSGGVAPPPGLNVPGPAKPTGPVIPHAADDPFGNMNAMAQIGTMQRAPEIVIVNDGRPVESVSTGSKAASIAKWAAIALVPLIIGWQMGAIGRSASVYNDGIDDAKAVDNNIRKVKKDLSELQTSITDVLKKNGGNTLDPALTKILSDALALQSLKMSDESPEAIATPDNSQLVFRAKQNSLSSGLSGQILVFYSHVAALSQMIQEHVRAAKTDDLAKAAAAGKDAQVTINGSTMVKYAVVLSNPSEEDIKTGKGGGGYGAQLVEIGPAFCQDGSVGQGGQCPGGAAAGLGYRVDPSGGDQSRWAKGDIAQPAAGQPFPLKSLVVLAPTGIMDTLVKGGTPSASEVLYQRRFKEIVNMIDKLLKEGNMVDTQLGPKANEGKKFSFFL
jgi:hypothetical protein